MVFGDTACGKSTFAEGLGGLSGVPVIHLDKIMDTVGRDDRISIGDIIRAEADKDDWIIEGNAFTKDPTYRIKRAETVFAFDFSPARAMASHVARYGRIKLGVEERRGSEDNSLNLGYFVPYVFRKFPPRKEAAIELARSLHKDLVIFDRKKQAAQYLAELLL